MANKYVLLLVIVGLCTGWTGANEVKKVISVYYVEESVNEISFIWQVTMINGKTKNSWSVDGKQISQNEFDQTLAQAKTQEWLEEHKKKEELQARKHVEMHNLRRDIEKQDIRLKIKEAISQIEETLAQLKKGDLESYYKFNEETIESKKELDTLLTDYMAQAKSNIEKTLDDLALEELQEFRTLFVPYAYKFQQFFLDTVKNAVNNCSDTKALKEYLQLLS